MFHHSKPIEKSIKKLDLDLRNPRLIGYRKKGTISSQKDLIFVLASRYEVIDICKSILQNGFHPDEIPIVIPSEDGKRLIVVEGNRRVSACKILENPELLKTTIFKNQVLRFKKHPNYQAAVETIKKLNVVILPSRSSAAAYLAAKHTQASIKGWSPYTQGAYYISLREDETITLADLKDSLNDQVNLTRIKEVVLFYRLSDFILELDCWSDEERNSLYDQIDDLKIEAIKRLIRNPEFKRNIGSLYINDFGDLITSGLTEDATKKVVEILARDAHFNKDESDSNILTTRQEDKRAIKKYIIDISSEIKSSDRVDLETKINISPSPTPANAQPELDKPKPKPLRQKSNNKLLHQDIPTPQHLKLAAMCSEAKRANSKLNLYSSALLARALIEITLKAWIKECGRENVLQEKYKEKAFNFDSILSFFEQDIKNLIGDTDSQKAIKGVVSDLQKTNREIMNLTNHNDTHILSEIQINHIQAGLNTIASCLFGKLGNKKPN